MHTLSRILSLIASVAMFGSAAAEPRAPADTGVQTGSVKIELIAQPRELELPSRFHLAMRLTNSNLDSVIFKQFRLTPLEEPGGLEVAPECEKQDQVQIGGRSSFVITCGVASRKFNDSILSIPVALFGSWSLLTLQAGEYRFVATAEVRSGERDLIAASETVPIRIRPTVWQVCAGAALGALLLVIFTFTSTAARGAFLNHERLQTMSKTRQRFEPILLWLGATVAASIFIFLTYRLKDAGSPITITVNDFYGGLVFGLFGVFIADYLASKLYARQQGGAAGGQGGGGGGGVR